MSEALSGLDDKSFENRFMQTGVYARFYYVPKPDKEATKKEGRPISKEQAYIEIRCAGNANNIVQRPVSEFDKRRFADAWNKFKAGSSEQLSGTRLEDLTWISKAQVEDFTHMGIRTLEQLADVNDQVCNATPGLYTMKKKAADWLKASKDSAPILALQAENDALKARFEALEASLKNASPAPAEVVVSEGGETKKKKKL